MKRITIAETKGIGTRTLRFILAFSVAAFVGSGVSYAKPKPPPLTTLNQAVCTAISGVWLGNICTIPAGTSGTVTSSFTIGQGFILSVIGNLTIQGDATITNAGTISVENAEGVPDYVLGMNDDLWKPGILIFGALNNSGTINIANTAAGTEGITVSYSLNLPADSLSPDVVARAAFTNSGTINISNQNHTRGIKNVGTLVNSASGVIVVANSINNSAGIYNRRDDDERNNYENLPATFKIEGIVTNAGTITISNSGVGADCAGDNCGYGMYNQGLFTNTGIFDIEPSSGGETDLARGLFNGGNITSYGAFRNARGDAYVSNTTMPTRWGSYNSGTMINYGNTDGAGTWYNQAAMLNLGTITNNGIMWDVTGFMINYATIYNHGYIKAGSNYGICIDESDGHGGC